MYSEPCAKLTMRVTPKMSDNPAATRNSEDALARPLTNWMRRAERVRAPLLGRPVRPHPVVGRQIVRAARVLPVDHDALAVLHGDPPDVRAHRRLVIERAEGDLAERRVDDEPLHRSDQLLGIGGARFANRRRSSHHRAVADDRALTRVVVELRPVGFEEALVLGRVDARPRVAGDVPAYGRFVFQRIEILGLTAQQVQDWTILEQPAQLAFTNELGE